VGQVAHLACAEIDVEPAAIDAALEAVPVVRRERALLSQHSPAIVDALDRAELARLERRGNGSRRRRRGEREIDRCHASLALDPAPLSGEQLSTSSRFRT
jgi:hypothetical protein